ncbi:MAG: yxnA [Acidobacteria bacterium]|jgi:short-subunit dehydrogenase|nr:yxnA [Acidobacteriota bacterium]
MKVQLKNINEQVMVITGATSGIGLTTARMAAKKGAKLVLVARNEEALRQLTDEINASGGQAVYSVADVSDENAMRQAANKAMESFGSIDTWVNNAGASVYGRITDVPTEDLRRIFETNVWGVVNGSKIAVEHFRGRGGAIINIGSEVSDAPVPLQGMYSASKHAIKGFTDALRMELEADRLPVSVTLIKPTAIHTPFVENAKNYLPYEPQLPPPVFAPELVAEAILYSARHPTRDFFIGETAKAHSSMALNAPRLYDKMNESMIDSMQNSGEPAMPNRSDGLYQTNSKLHERGSRERFVFEDSLYQRAKMHPLVTSALAIGGGVAIAALIGSMRPKSDGKHMRNLGTQGMHMSDIREKMEVVGADGRHIGIIDRVESGEIKLTRKDSDDNMHHFISTDLVDSVSGNRVMLSQTADMARQNWRSDNDMQPGRRMRGNLPETGSGGQNRLSTSGQSDTM